MMYTSEATSSSNCMNYDEQIIWNNSSIRITNCAVFWLDWYDIGIKCFKDMLSTSGDILTFLQFKEKYDFNINVLNYFSLVYAIPQKWKRHVTMLWLTRKNLY